MARRKKSKLILRGWRQGSLLKKIDKAVDRGYVFVGPIQYAPFGRKYLATMVMPPAPPEA